MDHAATTLDQIVHRAGQLYTLPRVAVQVLELTSHPEIDARQLKDCIENDPALASKILRVVNSSLFGLSREVRDLNQALALLGTKPLKLLVLGFSLPDRLFRNLAGDFLGRYWRRTLTRAVAAREISQTLWELPGDEAFLAGLLQDLGLLLLIQDLGEPFIRFVERVSADGGDVLAAERAMLGFDHTQLTARLLAHWRLPAALVAATERSSTTDGWQAPSSSQALPAIVRLADLIACLLMNDQHGEVSELLEFGRQYRRLSVDQLDALIHGMQDKVERLAEVLSLELPAGHDYRSMVAKARSRLIAVAEETAADLIRQKWRAAGSGLDELLALEEARTLSASIGKVLTHHSPKESTVAFQEKELPRQEFSEDPAQSTVALVPPRRSSLRQSTPSATMDEAGQDASSLVAQLNRAIASCRQDRRAVSLLLLEVDRFGELAFQLGNAQRAALLQMLKANCEALSDGAKVLEIAEGSLALILPGCDRRKAVEAGYALLDRVRRAAGNTVPPDRHEGFTISIGTAAISVPSKNLAPQDLVESAQRCLDGVRLSGGNGLKSIEIY